MWIAALVSRLLFVSDMQLDALSWEVRDFIFIIICTDLLVTLVDTMSDILRRLRRVREVMLCTRFAVHERKLYHQRAKRADEKRELKSSVAVIRIECIIHSDASTHFRQNQPGSVRMTIVEAPY